MLNMILTAAQVPILVIQLELIAQRKQKTKSELISLKEKKSLCAWNVLLMTVGQQLLLAFLLNQ
jgi:hypothetical protein